MLINMCSPEEDELPAPLPPPDVPAELRTGKVRHIAGTTIKSAIEKLRRPGRVFVSNVGLDADEQVYEHHGGIDKAVHGYCSSHYILWATEHSSKAHLYRPGAFGENFVTANLNEDNLCIGDKFSIGSDVIVEVSEPRQPCYKLNHRFEWARASIETQKTRRTG